MKEELTREIIEAVSCCDGDCDKCSALKRCYQGINLMRRKLAAALLEETDKPKVWDGAPEDAIEASVTFFKKGEYLNHVCKTYTRELPKSRARQIAEEIEAALRSADRYKPEVKTIESVLEKYAAELKGEA